MTKLPLKFLLWLLQVDLDDYTARKWYISILRMMCSTLETDKEKERAEKEGQMWLDRRN